MEHVTHETGIFGPILMAFLIFYNFDVNFNDIWGVIPTDNVLQTRVYRDMHTVNHDKVNEILREPEG